MNDDLSLVEYKIQVNQNRSETKRKNLFKTVFGERKKMRVYGIMDPVIYCIMKDLHSWQHGFFLRFVRNFLFIRLNMTFIKTK